MKARAVCTVMLGLVLSATVLLPAAKASEWDEMTEMSFSAPVEIPGTILPAGRYLFVLADDVSNRNIVQIFSPDRSYLYATLLTIPAYRMNTTSDTEVRLAERPHKGVEALLTWYSPGRESGHEFLYSRKTERKLAVDSTQEILAAPLSLATRNHTGTP